MGVLDLIAPILNPIIDRVFPDPKDRYDFQVKMAQIADQEAQREHDEMMGQMQTNTEEAKNQSMFVAGWRPAVGWICAVGIGYSFIVDPMCTWAATVVFHYKGAFPTLDSGQLMTLITGMLGFGGLRTYEKIKGLSDSTPSQGSQTTSPTVPVAPPEKKKILGIAWPF